MEEVVSKKIQASRHIGQETMADRLIKSKPTQRSPPGYLGPRLLLRLKKACMNPLCILYRVSYKTVGSQLHLILKTDCRFNHF